MATREIPRGEWPGFFQSFGTQHEGWLVTVETLGPAAREGSPAPPALKPVSAALKRIDAFEGGGGEVIAVVVGSGREESVAQAVTDPPRVLLEEGGQGAHAGVRIGSADGTATLVRFRSAVPPEMVDGVVLE